MWLIIAGACVGAIVALTIVEILGSYWKEIGAEGWRGRFASVTSIFWFPKGHPLPVLLLVALATISIAMWSIERSNSREHAAAQSVVGHITTNEGLIKLYDRDQTPLFDHKQRVIWRGKVLISIEIGGGIFATNLRISDDGAVWRIVSSKKYDWGEEIWFRSAFLRQGKGDLSSESLIWAITEVEAEALLREGFVLEK